MDHNELKKFIDGACQILKMGATDSRLDEFSNLTYIKFKYPNALSEFLKLDDSLILDYYQRFLSKNDLFVKTNIENKSILRSIIKYFNDYEIDKDYLGDAFEYLMSQMMAGDRSLGEFYTPRHIIETLVKMVNPQAGENVYDPFCGTGGILVECLKHNKGVTVHGKEITSNARIAKINIDLHGGDSSNIIKCDSLTYGHEEG
jgi:type I restriction enzyme M protein